MSSIYRPICLNHDPAIVIDHDLNLEGANGFASRDRIEGHEHCDIVMGRYSYPLIEVGCLGMQLPGPAGCQAAHRGIQWIDRDWLRLLTAATTPPNVIDPAVLRPLHGGCWTPQRLQRLSAELAGGR